MESECTSAFHSAGNAVITHFANDAALFANLMEGVGAGGSVDVEGNGDSPFASVGEHPCT